MDVPAEVADPRSPTASAPFTELENGGRDGILSPPDNSKFSGKTLLGDTPELKQAWKSVLADDVNKWTDDRALFRFETTLNEFTSSSTDTYPGKAPWPVTCQEISYVSAEILPGEIRKLFAYAEKVRSKEHIIELMRNTISAFQPDLWRARKMLASVSCQRLAESYASEAEIVVINTAELLRRALNAK